MSTRRPLLAAALVPAAALVLASCSSAVDGTPTGSGDVGGGPSRNSAAGGSRGLSGSVTAYCAATKTLGSGNATDPRSVTANIVASWTKAAQLAPTQVRPDVRVVANFFRNLAGGRQPSESETRDYVSAYQRVIFYDLKHCK